CSRLDEILSQSGRTREVDDALDLFRDHAQAAFCWKRLLGLMAKHPRTLHDAALELCTAPAILTGRDTLYEAGALIDALAPLIEPWEMERIEKTILDLEPDIGRRLIPLIPVEKLVTQDAKNLRMELEQKDQIIPNVPLVRFRTRTGEYTAEDWLRDKGVDPENPTNRKIRDLTAAVSAATDTRKKPSSSTDLQIAYEAAKSLWSELREATDADDALRESAWATLGQYAGY